MGASLCLLFDSPLIFLISPCPFLILQEQVQSNKDLDLPTQRELLAQFRCDEISAAALAVFNEEVRSVRRSVEAGTVVEGLGGLMASWKETALSESMLFYLVH